MVKEWRYGQPRVTWASEREERIDSLTSVGERLVAGHQELVITTRSAEGVACYFRKWRRGEEAEGEAIFLGTGGSSEVV